VDLRNWEFFATGSPVVGANVFLYTASNNHPNPNSPIVSTTTNANGMWEFTGLVDGSWDVKVSYNARDKWYKGNARPVVDKLHVVTTLDIPDGGVGAVDLADGTSTVKKIFEVTGTGSSPVLTYSSIPGTWRKLVCNIDGRSLTAATFDIVKMTFNSDTTAANYWSEVAQASVTTFNASEQAGSIGYIQAGIVAGNTSTASVTGEFEVHLTRYSKTSSYKPVRFSGGGAQSLASGLIIPTWGGGVWKNTAAITRVDFTLNSGANWSTDSVLTVWGWPA
jgi:hypothetical protein